MLLPHQKNRTTQAAPDPSYPPHAPPPKQLTAVGIGLQWNPADVAGSFSSGAYWAWFGNNYDWRAFLAALACSLGGDLLWCTGAWGVRRFAGVEGPGISGVLMRVPGMSVLAASPKWTREGQPRGWDQAGKEGAPGEVGDAKGVEGAGVPGSEGTAGAGAAV